MMAPIQEDNRIRRGTILRVVDADTFHLSIDLGYDVAVRVMGRLNGIDAPELSTPEGKAAKQRIEELCGLAHFVTVRSWHDHRTFARWVVDVWLNGVDDLTQLLIDNRLVKRAPRVIAERLHYEGLTMPVINQEFDG